MSKFFIDRNDIRDNEIELSGENFEHIVKVLRGKVGDELLFCDGCGTDFECRIREIGKRSGIVEIIKEYKNQNEPNLKITLFQAMPKLNKMELAIQKCVEIGVDRFIPVQTENTVVKLTENIDKKVARWNKISESASKQCGRGKIPQVNSVMNFKDAINLACETGEAIIPYEKEKENSLKRFAKGFKGDSISIFIGPEGGFTEDEIKFALENNVIPVTLGNRILRTETAGLVTSILLLYELEDF